MKKNLHEDIVYSTDPTLMNSPAFCDCVLHIICDNGSLEFAYDHRPFILRKDEIAVISFPRRVSDIRPGIDFKGEYIAAPEKFLHNLLPANNYSVQGGLSLFDNPIMKVSQTDAALFRRDVANIRERLYDTTHRFYSEMIGSLFRTMVYDLFDFHIKANDSILTTDRVSYITSRFFALIQSGKPKTKREVSFYARQLNVTPKYLSDTIKRISGQSASAHINRAATSLIIEYLKDNKYSITQIADEMNFTSVSYFSRYCTKHIGMSPSLYRTTGF